MFGKKKEEIQPPQPPTEVIESDIQEETPNEVAKQFIVEPQVQEQPKEEAIPEKYRYYIKKYQNSYTPQDFVLPDQAELHNLLFGILMELKGIKEAIKDR